jgi:hypothetical protein
VTFFPIRRRRLAREAASAFVRLVAIAPLVTRRGCRCVLLCSSNTGRCAAALAPMRLSVMIALGEPDPYLLAESEERPTQQGDRESKKDTGSVFVLQPQERTPKP